MQSFPDPFICDMPRLQYVLRGVKSVESKCPARLVRKRLPITPAILCGVHKILSQTPSDFNNIMLWAAATLCFFGFLRSGEITIPNNSNYDPSAHLNFSDISVDNSAMPSIIQVRIKASKTDPFRQGVNIHIGRTGNELCPVTALLVYLAARGNAPGLLFHFEDGSPLTKNRFVTKFRSALTQADIDSSLYSGHSFRIGAASTAAANGIEDSLIQTLGRWKSSAYLAYIKIPSQNLAAISRRICKNS